MGGFIGRPIDHVVIVVCFVAFCDLMDGLINLNKPVGITSAKAL